MSPKFKEGQIVLDHVNGRFVKIVQVIPKTSMIVIESQWYDIIHVSPRHHTGLEGMPESCLSEITDMAEVLYAQDHHDS